MRLIRQTKLHFREGNSDKVYEVDLCEAGAGEFLVNFRYGRRGQSLREGTKTAFPETREKAEQIFDRLVQSKLNKGYREGASAGPVAGETETETETAAQATPGAPGLCGTPKQRARLSQYLSVAAKGGKVPGDWKLSRVLWRAGEMGDPANVASLLEIKPKKSLQAYSLAWALGKSGDKAAVPKLRELADFSDEKVRRIATEALLRSLPEEEAKALAGELRAKIPKALSEILESGGPDPSALTEALMTLLHGSPPPHDYFYLLYTQARVYPVAREAVYAALRSLTFKAPWFRAVRHIFKAAEFRQDAEVFGLIARRFEKSSADFNNGWGYVYDPEIRKSQKVSEVCSKPDSKFGYSQSTRAYLRRRVCRTLKRYGELQDTASFVTLATGVLMAYDDEQDLKPITNANEYVWNSATRRLDTIERHLGFYAGYLPLNYLLYQNSDRYFFQSNKRWVTKDGYNPFTAGAPGETLPAKREEAFPSLWNQAPDAIRHLLAHSSCGAVHEFAVRVWQDNSAFGQEADTDFVLATLARPYRVTQELGLNLARERFDPSQPDRALLVALLGCELPAARELAVGWLKDCRQAFAGDADFIAQAILIPHDDVHAALRSWLGTARPEPALLDLIVPRVVATLLSLTAGDAEGGAKLARNARETLLLLGGDHLGGVSLTVIQDLLRHPLDEVRLLGAQMVSLGPEPPNTLPDAIWELLLLNECLEVREVGMRLFARMEDAHLLERAEILASFCLSAREDVRQAARPIVERLAAYSPGFGQDMVLQFYPLTLRQESIEGLQDDVYALLSGPLSEHLHAIPPESCFRMMESRYPAGQKLGFLILQRSIDVESLSIKQWVRIAEQDHLEGRRFVWDYFTAHVERVRREAEDALRLVDSRWDDTRDFAFSFFREQFTDADWTPDLLVSLCDSTRAPVQAFGKEMITRFFQEADGQTYLLKLSQHPSSDLQTFATNYLARFAAGRADLIESLSLYFTTVLSQVNRARVAKERVLAFLREEALRDPATAAVVVPILERVSATIAMGDKAACLLTLRDIAAAWPELATPVKAVEIPTCSVGF